MGEQVGATVYHIIEIIIFLGIGGMSIFKPKVMIKHVFKREEAVDKWIVLAYFIGFVSLTRVLSSVNEIRGMWF